MHLSETDSFASAPLYFPSDGSLLSDFDPDETMVVGLPPRRIDPTLLKDMKQVGVPDNCDNCDQLSVKMEMDRGHEE